jgi:hypothetical protein
MASEKVVYNPDELVFPGAWPFKDGKSSKGVTMGNIVAEMADITSAQSTIVGFDTHGWDRAKLPPSVYECCADEAIRQIDEQYRVRFNEIFGPLSKVKFESMREVYCLAATRRALVAVKEEESMKHDRDTIVVNDNDDTNSTGAVVDEQSPRKRAKKIKDAFETVESFKDEQEQNKREMSKKMSDDLP